MKNVYGKSVIVTGASSGIGLCTAKELAKNGCHVYGISRRGGERIDFGDGFVEMLKCDVTDPEAVKAVVKTVIANEGKIDILINAAGNGVCGSIEEVGLDAAKRQFEVNYFGVVNMLGCVLSHMRSARHGLIINVGSVGGIYSIPFQSHYSSSKYALEALTEALRIELRPYGVRACLVEPGDIKTGFTASRSFAVSIDDSAYGEEYRRAIAQMEKDEQGGSEPVAVVNVIKSLVAKKNPPVRKTVGAVYKVFVWLKRIFPARLVEFILNKMYPESKN